MSNKKSKVVISDEEYYNNYMKEEEKLIKAHIPSFEDARKKQEKLSDPILLRIMSETKYNKAKKGELKSDDKDIQKVYDNIFEEWKESQDKVIKRGKYTKTEKPKYLFITLSPKECEIEDLHTIIKNLRKKSWLELHSYTFEQRSETMDDMGLGKHIHMIIKNVLKAKSKIIQEFHNCIHKLCDKEKIDIKTLDEESKENAEKYMQGLKIGEKYRSTLINAEWRKQNALKTIYIINKETKIIDMDVKKEEKKYYEEVIDGVRYAIINDARYKL